MKRALLIIYILIAVLLININVWAHGEIIPPVGIINMAQINNFQEQIINFIRTWAENKVIPGELKAVKLDLPDIGPIPKISDSIESEADLLSRSVDKYI